jgi:ABC toxin N-terminal region
MWRWLRSYRVWLANLKVFLYPENWLTPESRLRIDGHVRRADGRAVPSVVISAAAVGPHADDPLGETTTDANGHYELTAPAGRIGSDVRVSAYDSAGELLASAPIVFGIGAAATIDITM